jgi:hypothetical protein
MGESIPKLSVFINEFAKIITTIIILLPMKNALIIVLIFLFILFTGCASQPESSSHSGISDSANTQNLKLHNVLFQVVNDNDTPLERVYITAEYDSSAYNSITILNAQNNMKGYTDENGYWTFLMNGSILYNISVSNIRGENIYNHKISPTNLEYQLKVLPIPKITEAPKLKVTKTDWESISEKQLGYISWICPFIRDFYKC